jgi:SM-20-related protein
MSSAKGHNPAMSMLDLDLLAATPLVRTPFDHLIVPGFLTPEGIEAVDRSFPRIDAPGSFPTQALDFGIAFQQVLDTLQGPEMTAAIASKFEVDLSGRPTMVTVRGRCQAKDGRIHTDSTTKIITVLIYMNDGWEADGGRLRLLNGPDDLDDMVAEVPPQAGTLLAFRRSENSWHGHKPFVGRRRSLQLNWVTDAGVVRHELARHRMSARIKGVQRFLGLSRTEH